MPRLAVAKLLQCVSVQWLRLDIQRLFLSAMKVQSNPISPGRLTLRCQLPGQPLICFKFQQMCNTDLKQPFSEQHEIGLCAKMNAWDTKYSFASGSL